MGTVTSARRFNPLTLIGMLMGSVVTDADGRFSSALGRPTWLASGREVNALTQPSTTAANQGLPSAPAYSAVDLSGRRRCSGSSRPRRSPP